MVSAVGMDFIKKRNFSVGFKGIVNPSTVSVRNIPGMRNGDHRSMEVKLSFAGKN